MEATPESKPPPYRSAEMGFGLEEIHDLMYSPPGTGCSRSFTALLELPPPQAVELLVKEDFPAKHPPPLPSPIFPSDTGLTDRALLELPPPQAVELLLKEDFPSKHPPPAIFPSNTCLIDRALLEFSPPQAVELLVEEDFPAKHPLPLPSPIFPSDTALIDRSLKLSTFASLHSSPESITILPVSSPIKLDVVKQEPLDSSPTVSNQRLKPCKRKEREKKVEESNKKSKKREANEASQDGSELPYVHVRARRGQATDSHSLAERARREKINARMKLLQELVPGCNKISGTTVVLDEIISHVQALQRQVEFLSMRLAAVNPRTDFNFDALAQSAFSMDNGYMGMFNPSIATEGQIINGNKQLQHQQLWHCNELHQPVWTREEVDNSNFITPDNPFLNYDSSANSAFLHPSHPKLEL